MSEEDQGGKQSTEHDEQTPRRKALSNGAMAAGLVAGYGAFGAIALRFLYPVDPDARRWQFLMPLDRLRVGESLLYRAPNGETVNVTRQESNGTVEDFIALSSTCPHLGCQVHWEPQNDRYFCPCHNGTFDPSGEPTGGPPADADQALPRYELRVEQNVLLIRVPTQRLVTDEPGEVIEEPDCVSAPGHDPCLAGRTLRARSGPRADRSRDDEDRA